jgi:hypothetical protein
MISLGTGPFASEQRSKPRIAVHASAEVTIGEQRTTTWVYDISASGAHMTRVPGAQLSALCKFDLPGYGVVAASVVRVEPDSFAVTFPPDPQLNAFMDDPEVVLERLRAAAN